MNDAHVRWLACASRGNSWMGGAHFSGFASSPRRSDSGWGTCIDSVRLVRRQK